MKKSVFSLGVVFVLLAAAPQARAEDQRIRVTGRGEGQASHCSGSVFRVCSNLNTRKKAENEAKAMAQDDANHRCTNIRGGRTEGRGIDIVNCFAFHDFEGGGVSCTADHRITCVVPARDNRIYGGSQAPEHVPAPVSTWTDSEESADSGSAGGAN